MVFLPQPTAAADNLKSLFNFQTKMAAHGSSEAMIKLGEMCEEGLGTERNEERAREWYQRARDKGHPDAQSHLDKLKQKQDQQSVREKAAKEKAAREQTERERAAQAESEKPEAAKQAMVPAE